MRIDRCVFDVRGSKHKQGGRNERTNINMTVGGNNASENDVEAGAAGASYNQFIPFMEETSDKSKHGVSEHSNTGLLPPQIQRSSESTSSGADLKMTTIESSFNNENVSSSRKSRISSSRRASTTEERQNPFAYREGNALIWRNVNMTLKAKNSKQPERKLLNSVWGEVPPGEITAIMGPSGAGELI